MRWQAGHLHGSVFTTFSQLPRMSLMGRMGLFFFFLQISVSFVWVLCSEHAGALQEVGVLCRQGPLGAAGPSSPRCCYFPAKLY